MEQPPAAPREAEEGLTEEARLEMRLKGQASRQSGQRWARALLFCPFFLSRAGLFLRLRLCGLRERHVRNKGPKLTQLVPREWMVGGGVSLTFSGRCMSSCPAFTMLTSAITVPLVGARTPRTSRHTRSIRPPAGPSPGWSPPRAGLVCLLWFLTLMRGQSSLQLFFF